MFNILHSVYASTVIKPTTGAQEAKFLIQTSSSEIGIIRPLHRLKGFAMI